MGSECSMFRRVPRCRAWGCLIRNRGAGGTQGPDLRPARTVGDESPMIEEEFGVEFPDRLLTRRSFQSVSSLTDVVEGLRSSAVSS